ncbi:restriction endonuclease subunit S [Streptomyces sp. NPDC058440]|uniref:restriction endonuclease subunit S n=1 Tax=Streptomyces sp. NPDC058440 TaxID=3346501 RepID=UPI003651EA14
MWDSAEIQWTEVRNVGDVRMGKQLSPAARDMPGQFPYLRVANVHLGRIDYADVNTMGFTGAERETYGLKPGDILLNEGQSLELVGRSAIYDGVEGKFCFQNTLIRFRLGADVLPAYAQVVFERWLTTGVFAAIAKQTTSIAHLGGDRFGAVLFPLIPAAAQRRIVEVIDSFSELERGIEASIAKTRLIHGEVARRVLLGENRRLRKIKDVATVSSGSTPSRARRDFWDGGDVPWVRTGEIDFNVITETGEHVTRKAVHEAGLRVYPQGTVLLAMYGDGATRGRVGSLGVEAAINQAAAAIVCDPLQVDHRYLYYFLETQYTEIRNIGQGSNRSNLNGALVGAIEIPLPSVEEQRELVISLETFDSKVQADRAELAKLRELKQGLVDDLLSGRGTVPAVAA